MHNIPLRDKVTAVLEHVTQVMVDRVPESRDQLEIYSGDLTKYLDESILLEVTNKNAQVQTLARSVPVNTLKQVVNKLGKAYSNTVTRTASDENDQDFVDFYSDTLDLDCQMDFSTKIFNLHNYCGLEPYLDNNGKPRLRILDATTFIPYSDDKIDPTRMTVAVRWVDRVSKVDTVDDEDRERQVDIYFMYTDTEFLIVDSEGDIRIDLMEEFGIEEGEHGLGIIPIIYVNSSASFLVPLQDTEKRKTAISISKLLTDLNYASLYLSHSKFYGIDIVAPLLSAGPDAMSLFTSIPPKAGATSSPVIGTLEPKINIEETLKLVSSVLGLHLTTQGLTAGQMETGGSTVAQATSGVSKMIDSADATDTITSQQKIFKAAEENGLWKLLVALHNTWVEGNLIKGDFTSGVSDDLDVSVVFEKKTVLESKTVVIDRTIKILDAGLISKRKALAMVFPDFTVEEIDDMLDDVEVTPIDKPNTEQT